MAERGTGFPRLSLSGAVKVIETAAKFGKSWPKEQFAGFGSQSRAGSAKSGAFAARVASLRDYGLIISDKETITLTNLGLKIAKPVMDTEREQAIRQAFLNVDTFKALMGGLDSGVPLSMDQVAQFAVFNLGISRDSKEKFLSAFVESGRYVGVIEPSKDRNTLTILGSNDAPTSSGDPETQELEPNTPTDTTKIAPKIGIASLSASRQDRSYLAEQGVSYSGDGWGLTVLLKTSRRIDGETRKKLRALIDAADELYDHLHDLENERGQ